MTELLTAGGLILTVLLAYLQIQRQQRASLALQAEHLKDEIRVRVYEGVESRLRSAASQLQEAVSGYESAVRSLQGRKKGMPLRLEKTALDLSASHFAASKALTELILHFEFYEMAFPRFESIRAAISEAQRRLLECNGELTGRIMPVLPIAGLELPPGVPQFLPLEPSDEDLAFLEKLTANYREIENELQGYLLDVTVEAQNELLGELFGRTIPPRNPGDPTVRVLKRDVAMRADRPKGRWV